MLPLWQLLILFCAAAPIGTALGAAQHAKVGFGGYTLAATVGLVVGLVVLGRCRSGYHCPLPTRRFAVFGSTPRKILPGILFCDGVVDILRWVSRRMSDVVIARFVFLIGRSPLA